MATRGIREWAWDGILLAAVCLHVFLAPFTKVEESFNLQATHDLLQHGRQLQLYDHQQFPGAVPRTFLGASVIAGLASPAKAFGVGSLALLYVVRLALGAVSVAAHALLRAAVAKELGEVEARCLALLAALQFHLPFYMSRPLPNVFALAAANLAFARALRGDGYGCLALLSAAAAVFRCDLLVLIAPMGLLLLAQGHVQFFRAAGVCALAAAAAAGTSVALDSAMWGRLVWPELEVLWFNTAENKSSEWGTSPPLWYFYSALPRALLGALPLAAIGSVLERRVRGLALAAVTFVALYSFLPHKELRFVFPALPLLNAAAAAGAARCLRAKGIVRIVLLLGVVGLAAGSALAATVMAAASAANYPGGTAMVALHRREKADVPLSVHIGNLAAISGVSRFLEEHPAWRYSKEEGLGKGELAGRGFDRLLTEWPEVEGYSCVAAVAGFQRMSLQRPPRFPPLRLVTGPQIYVLARSADGETRACGEGAPLWT